MFTLLQSYHFWGILSSAIYAPTFYGLYSQLQLIWHRRSLANALAVDEKATDIISLNRTFFSFLAFYANLILGSSFAQPDWYLIATRSVPSILTLLILKHIHRDKRNFTSFGAYVLSFLFCLLACFFLLVDRTFLIQNTTLVNTFVLIAGCLLVQGYIRQILILKHHGKTGGLSKRMYQMFVLKEASTICFSLTIGLQKSWPMFTLSVVLLFLQLFTLRYFYYLESRL